MTHVMAQGTFDLLHPGHLHYLRESRKLGDELTVVIARDSRVKHRKNIALDEESRRELVEALDMVDTAILGSEDDIFDSVERVQPDIITIGYDQAYEPEDLERRLAEHGFPNIRVFRVSAYEGPITSSTQMRERIRNGAQD